MLFNDSLCIICKKILINKIESTGNYILLNNQRIYIQLCQLNDKVLTFFIYH